jgi:hypothetical protein
VRSGGQGERAPSRLIEYESRRYGLAGMAVSQVVALRGPGSLALEPPADLAGLAYERRASLPGSRCAGNCPCSVTLPEQKSGKAIALPAEQQ